MKIGYTSDLTNLRKRINSYKTHNPYMHLIGFADGGMERETYYRNMMKSVSKDTEFCYYDNIVVNKFIKEPSFFAYEEKGVYCFNKNIDEEYFSKDFKKTFKIKEFMYLTYKILKNIKARIIYDEQKIKNIEMLIENNK